MCFPLLTSFSLEHLRLKLQVDEIGDPLMHLLRNSADHGLESNDVRIQRGKPEVGSIFLDALTLRPDL